MQQNQFTCRECYGALQREQCPHNVPLGRVPGESCYSAPFANSANQTPVAPRRTASVCFVCLFLLTLLPSFPLGHSGSADGLSVQILSQVLMACIRQVRHNEHFAIFSRAQQNEILRHVWYECFLLRVANWSIDISSLVER